MNQQLGKVEVVVSNLPLLSETVLVIFTTHGYSNVSTLSLSDFLAHKLCDLADTIFLEDIDFRIMAKGFLGKHTVDAGFGQFRQILKYVGKKRNVFVAEVDHRGTSQTCPNCRISVRKELKDRIHSCPECQYEVDRDIASAQELCNRGIEMLSTGIPS